MSKQDYTKKQKECKVDGCKNKHDSKGFCKKHYSRWMRYGNPLQRCKGDPNDYVVEKDIVYMNAYNKHHKMVCTFLIDKADLEKVSQHCWYLKNPGYITASINGKDIYLHRFLTQAGPGDVIDHDNRNKLDYRQNNLKKGDYFLNAHNTPVTKRNKVGVKGLSKRILKNGDFRFEMRIIRYGNLFGKTCKTIEEAVTEYKKREKECEKLRKSYTI